MKNKILKQFLLILSINLVIIGNGWSTTYYVAKTGNNSYNGTSLSTPWKTMSYAANHVVAGDIVYIKAGNYGSEQVIFPISGTATAPISFIGYKDNPTETPVLLYNSYKTSLDGNIMPTLYDSILPLLTGASRASGTGIKIIDKKYIIIKNIQITNYAEGLLGYGSANYNIVENVITTNTGNVDVNDSGKGINFGTEVVPGGYKANGNTIKNCIVFNSCSEGITIYGNNNTVENSRVYSNDNSTSFSSIDYYIVVKGNNNNVKGCYIKRILGTPNPLYNQHVGHGIGVKGRNDKVLCTGNTFENCTSVNLAGGGFYVRHRGVKGNTFTNCTSNGGVGFLVRDGASNNEFVNCTSKNCDAGIRFMDSSEDDSAQYAGRHNVFANCIFKKSTYAIDFNNYSLSSLADSNVIVNCIFYDADYLFQTERDNAKNKMINCIISDVTNLKTGSKQLNFDFSFCDFYNNGNGLPLPEGGGNIALDPLFVNAVGGNFNLQATSPCIDRGARLACTTIDRVGIARPQGCYYDMGAYEFIKTCSKNMTPSGTENNSVNKSYMVYPNPTEGNFTIEANDLQWIEVYNINGQKIYSVNKIKNNKTSIDLSKAPKGIYFVKIKSNTETVIEKIVVM